jgi:hypothetical protein
VVKAFLQLLDGERLESDFYRRSGQRRKRGGVGKGRRGAFRGEKIGTSFLPSAIGDDMLREGMGRASGMERRKEKGVASEQAHIMMPPGSWIA